MCVGVRACVYVWAAGEVRERGGKEKERGTRWATRWATLMGQVNHTCVMSLWGKVKHICVLSKERATLGSALAINHVQSRAGQLSNVPMNHVHWTLCVCSCVRFVGAGDRVFQVRKRER